MDPPPDAPEGLLSLEAAEAAATAPMASADFPSAAADEDRCRFFPVTAAFDAEHVVAKLRMCTDTI